MWVLGWHGNWNILEGEPALSEAYHDAAAVLMKDGVIVAAVEEERLDRIKHSNYFPARAIRHCLSQAGATLRDLDAIALGFSERGLGRSATAEEWGRSGATGRSGSDLLVAIFEREFQVDVRDKLHFCPHHLAHLYAAWDPSGFPAALNVCLDGKGDGFSGLVATCQDRKVTVLRQIPDADSLGNLYVWAIKFLGYRRFDEYKVMGLAPYGNPETYRPLLEQFCELQPDGAFAIKSDSEKIGLLNNVGLARHVRRKGEPFSQIHLDFAAALQSGLERIVFHQLEYYQKTTGANRLCLGGGVAHNCTLNGKILRSGLFEDVYVQPAAHDAGNALGAALSVYRSPDVTRRRNVLPHLYWGTDIGTAPAVGEALRRWEPLVQVTPSADICSVAAALLAQGQVLGWVQGRSEFGPRALGNRSILADPRPAENKTRINAMVKKREGYRPFAPAVLQERLHDFFEVPPTIQAVPFMIFTAPVRVQERSSLGAVTHIDGSARVQSVSHATNPRFHALISAFGRLTGVPILLNTSFNNNCEPIVETVDDAVACFLTTGIDRLVVGDFIVEKRGTPAPSLACLDLTVDIPPTHRLTRQTNRSGEAEFTLEFVGSGVLARKRTAISQPAFYLCASSNRLKTLRDLCGELRLTSADDLLAVSDEFLELWAERVVRLRPRST